MDEQIDRTMREMDEKYAAGDPYSVELAWDRDRTERIYTAVMDCARGDGLFILKRHLGRVLDVGCGRGNLIPYLSGMSTYVGVELSGEAVAQAQRAHPDTLFHACPIERWASEQRFETVISVESIEHWADVDVGLEVIKQHMAPDGLFVLSTPNADSLHHRIGRKLRVHTPYCSPEHTHEFGFEELKGKLEEHGFTVARSLGVCLAPYWALESEFGTRIRKLTDTDEEVVSWLGRLGEAVPELSFIQVHACWVTR